MRTELFLGQMMGIKRNNVSVEAHKLQAPGIIKYNRGHIEIANLAGLEDVSCECYTTVNVQHDRLLNEG